MSVRPAALAGAALLAAAWSAAAHSPYLRPANFAPSRDYVTVTGGLHEETALLADIPLRPGDFYETRPDGTTVKLDGAVQLKGLSAIDVPLPAPGTYRISTGLRAGRDMTWAQVDGRWRPVRPQRPPGEGGARLGGGEGARRGGEGGDGPPPLDAVPAGAPVIKSVGYLRADTYVTRGAPSEGGWKPTGEGLEFAPVANPTDVYLDKGFAVRVLLDGAPVPGAAILVRRGDESYADKKTEMSAVTDAQGRAVLRFPMPGAYVLETHGAPDAPGAAPKAKTYAVSLTVEANT